MRVISHHIESLIGNDFGLKNKDQDGSYMRQVPAKSDIILVS